MSKPKNKKNVSSALPPQAVSWMQQGSALHRQGRFAEALAFYQQVLNVQPTHIDALMMSSGALEKLGQLAACAQCLERVIALDPARFQCYFLLGVLAQRMEHTERAIAYYQQALTMQPDYVEANNNLGVVLKNLHRYEDAMACFQQVVAKLPDQPLALANLAECLKETGRLEEAVPTLRRMVQLKPDFAAAWSNLLLAQNYLADITPEQHYRDHCAWITYFPALQQAPKFDFSGRNKSKPRLRIGYVSPDLHTHSVSYFLEPLWRHHDHDHFEVFAYYSGPFNEVRRDPTNQRLRSYVDVWRDTASMPDVALAQGIYHDQIDILVDLSGHMADNRMAVFAMKPAPVQVSWLGYPNTTGLPMMDYRITDAMADPEGLADQCHSEKLIRLDGSFLCYECTQDVAVNPEPPARRNGYITFGSFNNLVKVQPPVIALWAKILHAVPDSRLLLKSLQLANAGTRQHCLDAFANHGIAPERLALYGMLPGQDAHLRLYDEMDIGLDPFPYNGTTTTCEAAWMGVPTLTVRGQTHASRVGASINTALGLQEWIATDAETYLAKAMALSSGLIELATLRSGLRERLKVSTLGDASAFARRFESACLEAWSKR